MILSVAAKWTECCQGDFLRGGNGDTIGVVPACLGHRGVVGVDGVGGAGWGVGGVSTLSSGCGSSMVSTTEKSVMLSAGSLEKAGCWNIHFYIIIITISQVVGWTDLKARGPYSVNSS